MQQNIMIVFLLMFAMQCECICKCFSHSNSYKYMRGCDDLESQALCFRAQKAFETAGEDVLFSMLAISNTTENDSIVKLESVLQQSMPPHDCFGALRTETLWPKKRQDYVWLDVLCQSDKLIDECELMKSAAQTWTGDVLDLSKSVFSEEQQLQLEHLLQEQDPISINCHPVMNAMDYGATNQLHPSLFIAFAATIGKLVFQSEN